ncbi:hypothetical protein [Haloarcula salinisoli]|uniref:Uncharacterized protein n=1 Tax=Haloarcula salinisoli TaxID=2487746 RepID=A0A8J7YF14_9EURY|nr:hypothetical protein [Halomicroarcula salinisoli]MBX0286991.1 hypothetical protein [Halomicroarcula salinisoli]MBX0304292.1 hypothetical protein [Halomicroarcula salinisoli]
MDDSNPTRRSIVKTGAGLAVAAAGFGTVGSAAAGKGNDKSDNGKSFGRVYANGELWRTNVVNVLDDRPDPEDRIYFLHDGEKSLVARDDVSDAQASPFVSEAAPGDRDWNGGQWTHFSAEVTDVEAFNEDAPLTTAAAVLEADYIETELNRPGFGPPNYFNCPLNGRA